jgi:hypothetical protein
MSTRDAANLLIAVNGSALAKNVGHDVPLFRSMRLETTDAHWELRRRALQDLIVTEATVGDQIERLIDLAKPRQRGPSNLEQTLALIKRQSDEEYAKRRKLDFDEPFIEIEFSRPYLEVDFRLWSSDLTRDRTEPYVTLIQRAAATYSAEQTTGAASGDRHEKVSISSITLAAVARAIAT